MFKELKLDIAASVIAVAIATAGISTVTSFAFVSEAQAWSIKGAVKKTIKAGKSVGRKTGRVVRKVNRVIVPSEIRNGATKAKRGISKAGRFVVDHPYGRRCKPGKYLQPICTVKGNKPKKVRTHRTTRVVHDHRTNTVVHDHRTANTK